MSLINVDPDKTREVMRGQSELGPILTSLVVPLVGSGGTKAERQTHYKTKYGE